MSVPNRSPRFAAKSRSGGPGNGAYVLPRAAAATYVPVICEASARSLIATIRTILTSNLKVPTAGKISGSTNSRYLHDNEVVNAFVCIQYRL